MELGVFKTKENDIQFTKNLVPEIQMKNKKVNLRWNSYYLAMLTGLGNQSSSYTNIHFFTKITMIIVFEYNFKQKTLHKGFFYYPIIGPTIQI